MWIRFRRAGPAGNFGSLPNGPAPQHSSGLQGLQSALLATTWSAQCRFDSQGVLDAPANSCMLWSTAHEFGMSYGIVGGVKLLGGVLTPFPPLCVHDNAATKACLVTREIAPGAHIQARMARRTCQRALARSCQLVPTKPTRLGRDTSAQSLRRSSRQVLDGLCSVVPPHHGLSIQKVAWKWWGTVGHPAVAV